MQGDDQEQLLKLAEQITVETDPQKFRALVVELNDLLEEKENHLDKHPQD